MTRATWLKRARAARVRPAAARTPSGGHAALASTHALASRDRAARLRSHALAAQQARSLATIRPTASIDTAVGYAVIRSWLTPANARVDSHGLILSRPDGSPWPELVVRLLRCTPLSRRPNSSTARAAATHREAVGRATCQTLADRLRWAPARRERRLIHIGNLRRSVCRRSVSPGVAIERAEDRAVRVPRARQLTEGRTPIRRQRRPPVRKESRRPICSPARNSRGMDLVRKACDVIG